MWVGVWGFGFLGFVELKGGEGGLICEDVVDPVEKLGECGSL